MKGGDSAVLVELDPRLRSAAGIRAPRPSAPEASLDRRFSILGGRSRSTLKAAGGLAAGGTGGANAGGHLLAH